MDDGAIASLELTGMEGLAYQGSISLLAVRTEDLTRGDPPFSLEP